MRLPALLRNLARRGRADRDLDDELRAYVDLLADEKVRAGVPAAAARRAALLEVGGVERVKEEVRAVRSGAALETLAQDVRYAARTLARAPGFTATALAALALGIGANTALFTLADSLLFRARPGVRDAEGLVWITAVQARSGQARRLTYPDFVAYRDQSGVVGEAAAILDQAFAVAAPGADPEEVEGQAVSASYFTILRAPLALGRGFTAEEDRTPGTHPVAVISHDLWRRRFGGDPAVLGRTLTVNGLPLTIVGVATERFNGDSHDERRALWVPVAMAPALFPKWTDILGPTVSRPFRAVGRLHPGVTTARADAALAAVAARLARADSLRYTGLTARTFPASAGVPPNGARSMLPFAALGTAVTGLVLLIACANVANLLLGRAVARRREIGIRLSLGAGRARVVRQLLTESLLLAVVAGACGLALARAALGVLVAVAIPLPLDVGFDWSVFGIALAIAVGAAMLFGLVPALDATRADVASALRSGALAADPRRRRLQGSLVVAQVALSLVLLVTSGLFLRSLDKASRVDVGFDASPRVLALTFDAGFLGLPAARTGAVRDALLERTRALPGVRSASLVDMLPLAEWASTSVAPAGPGDGDGAARVPREHETAHRAVVRDDFFRTAGIPLVAGRDFGAADAAGAPKVAVVSEALARRFWPGASPIGMPLRVDGPRGPVATVVGVAGDVRAGGLAAPASPMVYLHEPQQLGQRTGRVTLLARADGDARVLAPALRRTLRELAPSLPITRLRTLAAVRDESLAAQRYGSTILGVFGALALLLATMGVYAVMAFAVRQRRREIGVRVALGALHRQVVMHFVARGMRLTLVGVAIGLALSFAATRLLSSLLLGITPTDAFTFAGVSALLAAVACVACWLPSRRAARVDPMLVLRDD